MQHQKKKESHTRDARCAICARSLFTSPHARRIRIPPTFERSRLGDARESDAPVEKRRPVRHAQTTHLPAHVPLQHLGSLHVSLSVKHVAVQHLGQIPLPALQRLTARSSSSTQSVGFFSFFHSLQLRVGRRLNGGIHTRVYPSTYTRGGFIFIFYFYLSVYARSDIIGGDEGGL